MTDTEATLRDAARSYQQSLVFRDMAFKAAVKAEQGDPATKAERRAAFDERTKNIAACEKLLVKAAIEHFGPNSYEPFIISGVLYQLDADEHMEIYIASQHRLGLVNRVSSGVKIPGEVLLRGIAYRATVAEELVIFSERHAIGGLQTRFSFRRVAQCWCVSIEGDPQEVFLAHIEDAAELVRENFGGSFEGKRGEYRL